MEPSWHPQLIFIAELLSSLFARMVRIESERRNERVRAGLARRRGRWTASRPAPRSAASAGGMLGSVLVLRRYVLPQQARRDLHSQLAEVRGPT